MGIGTDGRRDLERTARVVRQSAPDVIGLEVVAGPTLRRESGSYGNALLTRLPVRAVERHDLSVHRREPRGLLVVHLDWGGGEELRVAVTHLGLRVGERRFQVRRLMDSLAREGAPLVLMGDFNEWLFLGRPRRWLRRHFGRVVTPATFPSRWPILKLDHISTEPPERLLELVAYRSPLARSASDHLPLLARLGA